MQQVADWLKTLGMSEYAERFAESDIDTSVLRDLTDQDLKELGVSLGHRRKMLRAIAELSGFAPTSPRPALTEPKPQDTAERRQVTVMFLDLAGSTALSADLESHLLSQRRRTSEAVNRVDGRNVDVGGTASRHSLRPIASGQYPSAVTKHDQSPGILLDAGSVD